MKEITQLASQIFPVIVGKMTLGENKEENTKNLHRTMQTSLRMAKRILGRIEGEGFTGALAKAFTDTAVNRAASIPMSASDEVVKMMVDHEITLAAKCVGMFKENLAAFKNAQEKARSTTTRTKVPVSEEELQA